MAITSFWSSSMVVFMAAVLSLAMASLSSFSLSSTLVLTSAGTFSPSSSICFLVWYAMESAWFLVSTASRLAESSPAYVSASFTIRSTSSEDRVDAPVILMSWLLLVPLSDATTDKMPLASMSNFTSIWGTPRGAGGIPSRRKLPRDLLSLTNSRSPCSTLISTEDWPSAAVEKTSDLDVGRVVLRVISLVITPPRVSRPRERGVTSNSTMSDTSPASTPAWTAAPRATTSSGFTCVGKYPSCLVSLSIVAAQKSYQRYFQNIGQACTFFIV
mmetsp:Transcript_36562/g.61621  ORF Transcript_36562/g.61621 Transcript_36562/m.61621 type:complete len:272 (+) Transcript_36562:473-1288(+)